MQQIHTYFEVLIQTPIGDYNEYISTLTKHYLKNNNIIIQKITFDSNPSLYQFQQKLLTETREKVIKSVLQQYHHLTYDVYKSADKIYQEKIFLTIRQNHRKSIEITIAENFYPISIQGHQTLICMKMFKEFVKKFKNCPYLNWSEIASNQYYDWDIECIILVKDIINWDFFAQNIKVKKLLRTLTAEELKSLNLPYDRSNIDLDNNHNKTLFIIKEYAGNLHNYFLIKNGFQMELKRKLISVTKLIWLDQYSLPLNYLNEEKLKFNLVDADYILQFPTQDKLGLMSQKAVDISNSLGLKIYTNWSNIPGYVDK